MKTDVAYTNIGSYYVFSLILLIMNKYYFIEFSQLINMTDKYFLMVNDFFKKLTDNHPFITICAYAGQDYVGIIQNRDDSVTTIYDYGSILEEEMREKFLELGDIWWWESNRLTPINLFLKDEWGMFRPYLRTFNNKSLSILHGPICSMSELSKKRSKRRSITLVKRLP